MMFRFYDDELHNLVLVASKSLAEIISYISVYDYHPPLQYILNKFFYEIFGLNEYLLSIPSIIFILTTIYLGSRLVFKFTGSKKWSFVSVFLMFIHPLIFLWGKSIRWYPFWTFLIILSIYLLVNLWTTSAKNKRMWYIAALIITLSISLYTNYQTVLFLAGIQIAAFVIDRRDKIWTRSSQTLIITAGVFLVFTPYIPTALNHLENFFIRKSIYSEYISTSPLISAGYFLYSIIFGQSIFPWDPLFIIILSIALIGIVTSIFYFIQINAKSKLITAIFKDDKFRTICVLSVILLIIFTAYGSISGLSSARGSLFLSILIVVSLVSFTSSIQKIYILNAMPRKIFHYFSITSFLIVIIWMIASVNVITGQHLHKSGLSIPVDAIINEVNKTNDDTNLSIITTDFVLTYYLMKANYNVLSPYSENLSRLLNERSAVHADSTGSLIFIQSYPGSLLPVKQKLENYRKKLFDKASDISHPIKLGYDPDYRMKLKFYSSAGIEKYRYTIFKLKPKDKWDPEFLGTICTYRPDR